MVHDSFVGTDNRYDGCQSVCNRNHIVRGWIKKPSQAAVRYPVRWFLKTAIHLLKGITCNNTQCLDLPCPLELLGSSHRPRLLRSQCLASRGTLLVSWHKDTFLVTRITSLDKSLHAMQYFCQERDTCHTLDKSIPRVD